MKIKPYAYWLGLLAVLLVPGGMLLFEEGRKSPAAKPRPRVQQQEAVDDGLEPLANSAAVPARLLPKNTVVLNMTDAKSIRAPFAIRDDIASQVNKVLDLPEGAGTRNGAGTAAFEFEILRQGEYHTWVRARWDNSCGNSISLSIDGGSKKSVGQDSVYDVWHWVKGITQDLAAGTHSLVIGEREDGIAIDQVILTCDPSFVPTGPVSAETASIGIRRFADDFARSPGHGMEAWNLRSGKWKIEFTLDPNRIPNQYSLKGECAGATPGMALVRGQPWGGSIMAFNALVSTGSKIGAVVDVGEGGQPGVSITVEASAQRVTLDVVGEGVDDRHEVGEFIRLGQWHHFQVERWANVLRVKIDDQQVYENYTMGPRTGGVGLYVERGAGVFDDFEIEDAPWQADGLAGSRIPWSVAQGAEWFRATSGKPAGIALIGREGSICTRMADLLVVEAVILGPGAKDCVSSPEFQTIERNDHVHRLCAEKPTSTFELKVGGANARLERIAVRFGKPVAKTFRLGPYHFSQLHIEDPSDYADFTAEEWKETRKSPNKDLLKRGQRPHVILGRNAGEERSIWIPERGRWTLRDKALLGMGPGGRVRLWRDINSDLEAVLRVKRTSPGAITDLVLYSGLNEPCARVRLGDRDDLPKDNLLAFPDAKPGVWHTLHVRVDDGVLAAQLDEGEWRTRPYVKGIGGTAALEIHSGTVWYDDIEFLVRREGKHGHLYAFDRRETDWWHVGGTWRNHGGISCVLASNWISLAAPKGMGILWNKKQVKSDLLVSFNVEEASEWYGWKAKPSHVHFPYDNIQTFLTTEEDTEEGYRLEVNSRNRQYTVLYRNGIEVANVNQRTRDFPIRYVGRHEPYQPRRNRITLAKRGGLFRVVINGKEVLRYTDPAPLPVTKVGVGGYRTHFNLSNIEICELPKTD